MEREKLIGLVTRAQQGNSTAMDELFSAFYNDVYYFALKTVKDSDTACDITQEAFLEIINTIGSLKEPAAFVTWMKQITYHQCTRYFKKKKEVLVEEDEDGNTIFDTLADESEGSIPAEVYEKEEFRSTILGIINELTEEQRSAVMMYYFDELTVAQIAEIQGVSEGTVKSRLNYARKALKKSVESYEKKHNIRLHSFSFLPLFALFFGKELMPVAKAAEIHTVVAEAAGTVGTGAAGTAGAAAAAKTAGGAAVSVKAAAAAGTGIAAKIAAVPLATKVVAGVLALSVAVGGGVALAGTPAMGKDAHGTGEHLWADCVDEDYNCTCDICAAGIHFIHGERYAVQAAHDSFCDNCGISLGFNDEDMDNICDECGEYPCGTFHNVGHCDGDSDGICDNCGNSTAEQSTSENPEVYWELDGLCDSCGAAWDFESCFCSACNFQKHTHGEGNDCGKCTVCGTDLLIIDLNGWGKCDLCGEGQCGNNHPHLRDEGFEYCFICGAWMDEPIPTLEAPVISVVVNRETATVTITPVEGATRYEMRINGNHMGDGRYDTTTTTITITADMLTEGENTVIVCACNDVLYSPDSNTVTVGKLPEPDFTINHDNGNNLVTFPGPDASDAEGYIIYDENNNYLTTVPAGESFDFNRLYQVEGTYLLPVAACAEGYINSETSFIWVFVGETTGGGFGCTTTHRAPTLSLNGAVLTITNHSSDPDVPDDVLENFDIFINGTRVTGIQGSRITGQSVTVDLSSYNLAAGDVITVRSACTFEAGKPGLTATIVA